MSAQPIARLPLYSLHEAGIGPSYGLAAALAAAAAAACRPLLPVRCLVGLLGPLSRGLGGLRGLAGRFPLGGQLRRHRPLVRDVALAQQLELRALGVGDELGIDALLLGFPVFAQVVTAGDAHQEQ